MCPRAFSLAAQFTLNFYNNMHPYYGGIDLHARILYVCIIDPLGEILVHKEISANSQKLHQLLEPSIGNIVMGVEYMHCWYWVSDKVNAVGREGTLGYFCEDLGVDFILGYAAIHGGTKTIDAFMLLMFPIKSNMSIYCRHFMMFLRPLFRSINQ